MKLNERKREAILSKTETEPNKLRRKKIPFLSYVRMRIFNGNSRSFRGN